MTEKPKADFVISPSDTICVNSKVTFKNTSKRSIVDNGTCKEGNSIWTISPATGWNVINGKLGNDFNSDIPSIWETGSNELGIIFTQPGVYSIKLKTGSDFCGINEIVKTVCVNALPTGSFTLDKNTGCGPMNVSAAAISSIPACGQMRYRWSIKYQGLSDCEPGEGSFSFISGTSEFSQNPVLQFAEPGIYSLGLAIINPGGACSTVIASQEIMVKSKPVIKVGGVLPTICQNNFISPIVQTNCLDGMPATYLWTFEGGVPATSAEADPGKIFYNTPGNYAVKLTVTNECGTETYSSMLAVDPSPELTLPPDLVLCQGASSGNIQFSALPASSGISWNNNNNAIGLGLSGTSGNIQAFTALNNTSAAMTAIISVTAKLGNCLDKGTLEVKVNPKPKTPKATDVTYCENDPAQPLEVLADPGNTLLWYNTSAGGTGETVNPIPATNIPGNFDFYVSQQNTTTHCGSDRVRLQVIVNKIPGISSLTPKDPVTCASSTGSLALKGLLPNTSYEVVYTKNSGTPVINNLTANSSGTILIPSLSAGTYSNIFVRLNGCASALSGPFTLSDPDPPATPEIKTNSEACEGQQILLEGITSLTGAITYNWTGPNGFKSQDKNPVITNASLAMTGDYSLTITQNNCTSIPVRETVVVNALPAIPLAEPVAWCLEAESKPLSATAALGNSLIWYSAISGGTTFPQSPIPPTNIAGDFYYYVSQADNKGCESKRAPLLVTIHPHAKAEFSPPALIQCPPFLISTADINLKEFPLNNKEYRWYADGVYLGSGTEFPGYTLGTENETVEIRLETISLFGCNSDTMSKVFSTPKLPRPSFTLSVNEGCAPLEVTVVNTTPEMELYNYVWSFLNGQTSTAVQPGVITFPADTDFGDTTYKVILRISSICDAIVMEKPVYVKSKPKALFTPTKTEGCSPMKVTFKNTSKGLNTNYHWDFGDGNTHSTNTPEEVQHTFYAGTQTNYTVRLTASNECGSDVSEFIITVAPNSIKLNFAMNGPDHFGCQPHTVNFYNNSSGASSYYWDFGDGNFKSTTQGVETVSHTYLIPGEYEVKLLAQSSCNDTTATDYVHVYPKPTAAFKADHYIACKGNPVRFSNQSALATSYLWEFGDGNTSTLAEPLHIYTSSGIYTVRLTAYKLNGPGSTCTDVSIQQIQVMDTIAGNFTMSDSLTDCAPLTVIFENEQLSAISALWDFGDGETGAGNRVVHTYLYSGTYHVTLKVATPGGCNYVTTKTVNVNGPSGTLQYAGGFNCSPAPVRLEVNSTNTTQYEWDFGDGNIITSTESVIFHEYTKPGLYLPAVTLRNGIGCNYFIKGKDTVKIDKVDAGFITIQERICASTTVIFRDTSHVFFGTELIKWNFGDGTTAEGNNVSHTYTVSGKYWIEMTVLSNSGCSQTIRRQVDIHVNNIPTASIIAEESKCTNQAVLFRADIQSADPLNTMNWKISNGVTGSGESFDYTFIRQGNYTIDFMGITENGCSVTTSHSIEIKPSPVVRASGDATICLGNTIQLNASGAIQYQWTPLQSLSCTTCPNPVASPLISAPYVIEGLNSIGCPGYDTVNVTVIQPLQMTSSGNDTICIGQSANLLVSGAASYQWTPAHALSSTTISNPVADPRFTTSYRVVGYDGHHCFTDTAFIIVAVGDYPTVDLGPDKTLAAGTILPMTSTITEGPVKEWKWTPPDDLNCAHCPTPDAHIKKDITYNVEITNIYGCKAEDDISIKVFCEKAQVFIPNAFTPDGDGINDVLMVRGKGIVMVKSFRIFNRWGQLVFERNNFPPNEISYGWDGKIAGRAGPSEVYVYTAEVICENGVPFTYKGNTTIIK